MYKIIKRMLQMICQNQKPLTINLAQKLIQLLLTRQLVYSVCSKLPLQLSNKMNSAKNIDFNQYCGDLSESIDYLESQIGNQSPIYRNSLLSFRTFPKNMPDYSSEKDLLDACSMEEQLINNAINNNCRYKCFKCYGTNSHAQAFKQYETVCPECEGTQLISDTHALASILDKVLMLKVPSLTQRKEQLKKEDRKKNQLNSLFGSQSSIQEQQSCAYYPDQRSQQCSNCYKQFQTYTMYSCKQCRGYFVCQMCYQRKKYNHPINHDLYNRHTQTISLRICPTTMKRISEEGELQDNSNYLDSSQSLQIKCHNCNEHIEQCYEACLNCEKEGFQFIICAQCSRQNNFVHDPNHDLGMKTLSQASKLLRLSSKPSATESQATQSTPPKSKVAYKDSIILFTNYEPEDAQEKYQNSMRKSDSQQDEDLTHLLVKKKGKKRIHNMQQSVVSIDMQCSIQAAPAEQDFAPTVTPFAFSNISNQRINQKDCNPQQYLFNDYQCDICNATPIKNKRYHCKLCENYDLCEMCYEIRSKRHEHRDYEMFDGLQIIRKNRQSIITKMQCGKSRLSVSRVSLTKTRVSQFNSFK